jgi:lysophospholipase L1-like esterase
MGSDRRALLLRTLLLAVSLALTLGIMEAVLQRIYPPRPRLPDPQTRYIESPLLGWVLPPNSESFSIEARVRVNSLALRDEEFAPRKPPGEWRVLCLGDSLIFGYGTEIEDTFPRQLARRLAEDRPGPHYRAINAGVSGYNTRQELIYLLAEGLRFEPDLVVIGFYWNDLLGNDQALPALASTPRIVPGAAVTARGQRRLPTWIVNPLRRSILVYLAVSGAKSAWGLLRPPTEELWVVRRALFEGNDALLAPYLRATGERLLQIQAAAAERGVPALLLVYPMEEQILRDGASLGLAQELREIWAPTGMPFVDIEPDLTEAVARGETPFIPYDGHPNALGHRIAVDRVHAALRERNLLPLRPAGGD